MNLVTVNDIDITPYINKKSYKVNSKMEYESWQDGNFVEHRIQVRKRITGSFEIAVYGYQDMDLQAFLDNWNEAVNNGAVTMGLFVQNDNQFKAIEAYYSMSGVTHHELLNGDYYDRLTVSISER